MKPKPPNSPKIITKNIKKEEFDIFLKQAIETPKLEAKKKNV